MNKAYLVALQQVSGLGPIRLKLLLEYFSDSKLAWEASIKDWQEIKVPHTVIQAWQESKKTTIPDQLLESILNQGIKVISIFDPEYSTLLKEIHDPPIVLYYFGENLEVFKRKSLGVVGTRQITSYGRLMTERFINSLVNAGLVIVSGLARGVDTVAHQETLKAKGQTIAVLGGGLNQIFPSENTNLVKEIARNGGLVISEFSPNEPSLPGNFPARNRIISGLSVGVLVTEAAIESGSLITARCALEQGREVYALPGPITSSQSIGTLNLIKQGAKLVTEPEEILEDLGMEQVESGKLKVKSQKMQNITEVERRVLDFLSLESRQVDEICRELKLPAGVVAASLVKMEIFGLIKNLGGGVYLKLI